MCVCVCVCVQARIDQAIEKEELTRSAFDMAKKHEQELTAANNKYVCVCVSLNVRISLCMFHCACPQARPSVPACARQGASVA